MRLVTAWLAYRKSQSESAAASARYLSAQLGKQYTASRIWEWEHDKRPMPGEAAQFMRTELLPELMRSEKIDADHQRRFQRILDTLLN